jgi:non-heme chloroperoxidase
MFAFNCHLLALTKERPMNPSSTPINNNQPVDADLAEQANIGHGVPSQDPDPAAQIQLDPEEAAREAESVLTAGGLVTGLATGAAIGVAVGGPVGVLVGASLGALAGTLAAGAASAAANVDGANSGNAAPNMAP